jgi:hypothetical protein
VPCRLGIVAQRTLPGELPTLSAVHLRACNLQPCRARQHRVPAPAVMSSPAAGAGAEHGVAIGEPQGPVSSAQDAVGAAAFDPFKSDSGPAAAHAAANGSAQGPLPSQAQAFVDFSLQGVLSEEDLAKAWAKSEHCQQLMQTIAGMHPTPKAASASFYILSLPAHCGPARYHMLDSKSTAPC